MVGVAFSLSLGFAFFLITLSVFAFISSPLICGLVRADQGVVSYDFPAFVSFGLGYEEGSQRVYSILGKIGLR